MTAQITEPLSSTELQKFNEILDERRVRALFQPVVDFANGQVVGYEALARGPVASPYESPLALFAAAERTGRISELDWLCRAAAFEAALADGASQLAGAVPLFLNCEPTAFGSPCPPDLQPIVDTARRTLHVVMEVTERDIARDPAGLLSAVAQARDGLWGVALGRCRCGTRQHGVDAVHQSRCHQARSATDSSPDDGRGRKNHQRGAGPG